MLFKTSAFCLPERYRLFKIRKVIKCATHAQVRTLQPAGTTARYRVKKSPICRLDRVVKVFDLNFWQRKIGSAWFETLLDFRGFGQNFACLTCVRRRQTEQALSVRANDAALRWRAKTYESSGSGTWKRGTRNVTTYVGRTGPVKLTASK